MHKGQFSNTHLANHQLYCLGRVGYRVFYKKTNIYFFYFSIINMFSIFPVFFIYIYIYFPVLYHKHQCCAIGQVLPRPQLIFPSKTWFFGIYLNFQRQKSLKNQYLPHSESKSYQINSIKSCSSRYFQQHQRHIPLLPKYLATV